MANRFLLFGAWTGSLFGLLMATIIARMLTTFLIALMLTLGTTTAISIWLGFFAPEAWVRWLRVGAAPISA